MSTTTATPVPTPDPEEDSLLQQLKSPVASVRIQATRQLWERWMTARGQQGMDALDRAATLFDDGQTAEAEAVLDTLIANHGDWAEAYNQRALLRFRRGNHQGAIDDCRAVLALKPWHFGALHGLGLCHRARGEWAAAVEAFSRALAIQPHASRQSLDEVRAKLN